jgi:hypothetical protein
MFLRSLSEPGCGSPINYSFSYAGETTGDGYYYTTALPDSVNTTQDYWGYYTTHATSGSLFPNLYFSPVNTANQRYHVRTSTTNSGYTYSLTTVADRSVDPSVIQYGSLVKVVNSTGGSTTITYEPNDYFDPTSGATEKGGGIRVKQLVDYDGMNTANNITRNYTYINPSTSFSSGKPVSLPQYAFTIPYSGTASGQSLWIASTAFSAFDLSSEDHTVMYEYFKESKTGAGSSLYQFYTPATNFDVNAAPDCSGCSTEWFPTVNLTARPTCVSYGIIASSATSYPFVPNPNYDFERGLPKKMTTFNDAGTEVSETNYTYNRLATPLSIAVLNFEDQVNSGLTTRNYGKYLIYYNTGELTSQQTTKVFDSQNLTQSQQTTVNYTYGGTYHKLKTQQATNSDGSVMTTTYSYLKDYTLASGTNANITALYNLGLLNINVPVESYTTIQKGTGATLTTQAALTLFNKFIVNGTTLYRPSQQLSMVQPNGITFAPLTISGQTLTPDPNYFITANYTGYDLQGVLATSDDGNNNVSGQLYDHVTNQPVALVKNAAANEVVFLDFDSDLSSLDYSFTYTGTPGFTTDRNGKTALTLSSGQTLKYASITKNTHASNYIFSTWINAAAGGNITLTLTPTTGSPVSYTLPFTATTGWQYVEWPKKSVSAMTATFSITISTSATVGIDDILFYPENAEMTTLAYDLMTHTKVSQTNTNGVAAYFRNDRWGRLVYQLDQDRNIVLKNTYLTPSNLRDFVPTISTYPASGFVTGSAITFTPMSVGDSCTVAANKYTWNFGDSTAHVMTTSSHALSHTYTAIGTYPVTLTITSDYFPTKVLTENLTVTVPPPTSVPLQYINNAPSKAAISSVSFYQGSTLIATFSAAQLNTSHVTSGTYTIKVVMTTTSALYDVATNSGYGSVSLTGTSDTLCQNATTSGSVTYTYTANLTGCPKLVFNIIQGACSGGGVF